jgi:xanthine dehydrogenase large subunit
VSFRHDSSAGHVSGESEFIDDRPFTAGELHVDVVYSPHAHARIRGINLEAARKVPGVVALFTHKDLHHNRWGTIFQDQPLLAEDLAQFAGEPIVVVAAESKEALLQGKRQVKIDFEKLTPVLTIDEAKSAKQYLGFHRKIERGDWKPALATAPHKLTGQVSMAGQDHFYLESQASIAYPKEDGQIEVHSSSQHPTEVQHVVAHALGVNFSSVVCVVKRMGGAFGGKESQAAPFAALAALVAHKTGRAARIILSKDDDMIMTGKRNPFQNDYRVGFDHDGRILALDAELFSDGGAYADLSTAIMERAMLHVDNAYFIPNIRIQGQVCKTHHHPHTAFRGFGGPKGVVTIENIIEDIARVLGKDPLDVRKLNCYQTGHNDTAPYGQVILNNQLPRLFETLEKKCDYRKRRAAIAKHNQESKTHLHGLSMTAVKFGIAFTTRFLNQGGALVNILTDGTVQVSTGATEMGQGVTARIAQVVAESFGIPYDHVRVMSTSTEKIPNTSPTAASSGTDINAAAAKAACDKIKARLNQLAVQVTDIPAERRAAKTAALGTEPELEVTSDDGPELEYLDGKVNISAGKSIPFAELVREAYFNRISLSDTGYFKYSGIHYDKTTGQGSPFFYYTQGVAASEVQIDRFTGELKVLRSDVLMDLGRPINEGLDLGQCSGGFIQGMGWVTTEALYYQDGKLLSHSPSTYKIPNIQDIPRVFNLDLIDNGGNEKNIGGSKAVGEPPLLLAVSVWTAVKDAVAAAKGGKEPVKLRLPATHEEIFAQLNL